MLDDGYAEQIGSVEGVVEPMVLTAEVKRKEFEKTFNPSGDKMEDGRGKRREKEDGTKREGRG